MMQLKQLPGLSEHKTCTHSHTMRRHSVLDAKDDGLAPVPDRLVRLLGGTYGREPGVHGKSDVGVARGVCAPELTVA